MQNRGRFVMLASRQDQPTDDRSAVDSRRPVRQAAEDRFGSDSDIPAEPSGQDDIVGRDAARSSH